MQDMNSNKGVVNSIIERVMDEIMKKGTTQEPLLPVSEVLPQEEGKPIIEEEPKEVEQEAAPVSKPSDTEIVIKQEEESEQEEDIEDVGKLYDESFQAIKKGKTITGTVSHIEKDGVFVYVGGKSEGFISLDELSLKSFSTPEEVVTIGEEIKVSVLDTENKQGRVQLSKKRVDLDEIWDKINMAFKNQEIISAKVIGKVKGGLTVDLEGINGFVPASQIGLTPRPDLNRYEQGQILSLKVLEFKRKKRDVILSQRLVLEENAQRKKDEIWNALYEGKICKGKIVKIADFGAFIDLQGITGLIPFSELSWRRIKHPNEIVKIGEDVEAIVLKVDKDKGRVSLSLRQMNIDPWEGFGAKVEIGQIIDGTVSKIAKSYIFVQLSEGIEGIVPASELSLKQWVNPSEVVSVGQEVQVKILNINVQEHKILMSMKRITHEEQKVKEKETPLQEYISNQGAGLGTTIGDIMREKFGDKIIAKMNQM